MLDDDVSQLRTLEQTFAAGMNAKNVGAVMAVYAPGEALFVFDAVGPPSVHCGWDAYRLAFTHMFESISGPLQFTISDLEVQTDGELGYGHSLQRVRGVHVR